MKATLEDVDIIYECMNKYAAKRNKDLLAEVEMLNKKCEDYERAIEIALDSIPEKIYDQNGSTPNQIHSTIKHILVNHKLSKGNEGD